MTGEKCAVEVHVGIKVFIAFVHYILVWLMLHQVEHALGIAAYHGSSSPCYDCRQERYGFDVFKSGKPARELHGIIPDEFLSVYSCGFRVEQFPDVGRHGEQWRIHSFSTNFPSIGFIVRTVDTNAESKLAAERL